MENQFELNPLIELIYSQGLPEQMVVVLLLFPIIATFVVLLRQVFGLQAFGIYTPTIITVVFMAMAHKSLDDLAYPIAIYIFVIVIGMLMRFVFKKLRLLYLPRVALNLTIITFSVLFILTIAGFFGMTEFSFFPILILITIVEKFVLVQIEKGTKVAASLAFETLFIAIIGYLIMTPITPIGQYISIGVQEYPYLILFIIPVNLILGKWTGLRVTELIRFKEILKKIKS